MNGAPASRKDLHQLIDSLSEDEAASARRVLASVVRVLKSPAGSTASTAMSEEGPPIWEQIATLGSEVPEDAWRDVPRDLAVNHDYYLHGAPKVEP
jgi:hypothetical protein